MNIFFKSFPILAAECSPQTGARIKLGCFQQPLKYELLLLPDKPKWLAAIALVFLSPVAVCARACVCVG